MMTTESLLTDADAFGIPTATPAQRAACRVLDGKPLGELADHPDVVALVGGPEALAQLPTGEVPREVVFLAAIRSAKTIISCAAAIRMALTVDVSGLGPGEVPRVSLLSLTLDASAVAFRLLDSTVRASTTLRRLLVTDACTSDTLTLRHPSGRPVEIRSVAGARAGGSLVARWSAGLVVDEAPRMNGASDAVVNLDHAREAILGRLLPGAQALYIGSPHAPMGPVYDWTTESWAKPSRDFVVLRGTGPMLNPTWWTPNRCQSLLERNPAAHATDVMGEFADPESGLLSPVAIRQSTREAPLELPSDPWTWGRGSDPTFTACVDPSEGSAKGNGFALALVQNPDDPDTGKVRVVLVREFRGQSPDACWEEIASVLRPYGVTQVHTDQYAASANADLARRHGLDVEVHPTTAASKLEDWTNFATLLHTGRLELAPDPTLRRDLLSVKRRATQQGSTIVLPRSGDGRHCDLAAALCGAIARTAQFDEGQRVADEWSRALDNMFPEGSDAELRFLGFDFL